MNAYPNRLSLIMRQFILGCFTLICLSFELPAQTLRYQGLLQDKSEIMVLYELKAGPELMAYEAQLFYSLNGGGTFHGPARSVRGSVGKVEPGPNQSQSV